MKTRKYLIFTLLASLFLATPFVAKAGEIKVRDNVIIQKDRIVNDNIYAAAANINVEGTINGDLIAMGDNVEVSGKIKGDLIAAASSINITGTVEGNVRAVTQKINLTGSIKKNANLMAQTIDLGENSNIGWDLVFLSESININGSVGKDLQGSGSKLVVSGSIGGDIKAKLKATAGEKPLTINDNAKINGNVYYKANSKGSISENASIAGALEYSEYSQGGEAIVHWFKDLLYSLFGALLVGIVLVTLFRNKVNGILEIMHEKWEFTALKGLGILILVPLVSIALFLTIVGIPLSLLLIAFWLILLLLSRVIVAIFLGQIALKRLRKENPTLMHSMIFGIIISWVLFSVPVIGWFLSLLVIAFGTGSLYNYLKLP